MFVDILKVFAIFCVAVIVGKLISKLKLPSILGWLLTGMFFGPCLVGIVNQEILSAIWYERTVNVFECMAGLMIGTEILFKKLKVYGAQIAVITIMQSLGTFIFVTAVFAVAMAIAHLPIYLAFIFGGIALATAPAPALSIVNEFKTRGPVTRSLIPIAALDDVVGVCVFFTVISIVATTVSSQSISPWLILAVVVSPFVIGIVVGLLAGVLLKKKRKALPTLILLFLTMAVAIGIGFVFDFLVFKKMSMNYILLGMAFSATFANIIGEERLGEIMKSFNTFLNVSLIVVILNLGMPLDYKLIVGAGVFTLLYIVARSIGKIGGSYVGAKITKAEPTIKKYLGLTLLPHSGVSLVFTGIAVSTLAVPAPKCAEILQGTIAAAAIINEVIAVIIAKQAFKWAGEMNTSTEEDIPLGDNGHQINDNEVTNEDGFAKEKLGQIPTEEYTQETNESNEKILDK